MSGLWRGGEISKFAYNHIKITVFSGKMKMLWTFPPFPEVRTYFRVFKFLMQTFFDTSIGRILIFAYFLYVEKLTSEDVMWIQGPVSRKWWGKPRDWDMSPLLTHISWVSNKGSPGSTRHRVLFPSLWNWLYHTRYQWA